MDAKILRCVGTGLRDSNHQSGLPRSPRIRVIGEISGSGWNERGGKYLRRAKIFTDCNQDGKKWEGGKNSIAGQGGPGEFEPFLRDALFAIGVRESFDKFSAGAVAVVADAAAETNSAQHQHTAAFAELQRGHHQFALGQLATGDKTQAFERHILAANFKRRRLRVVRSRQTFDPHRLANRASAMAPSKSGAIILKLTEDGDNLFSFGLG